MPQKVKPGPSPSPIDPALIENLAACGCTVDEIAAAVGLTKRHLLRRLKEEKLSDAIEKGRAKGRATLRGWQWKAASKGNVTAQIWLGKQLLGQRSFEKEDAVVTEKMPPLIIETYREDTPEPAPEPGVQQSGPLPRPGGG